MVLYSYLREKNNSVVKKKYARKMGTNLGTSLHNEFLAEYFINYN